MSKNQFVNAAKNKDNYALCFVDMVDHKVGQPDRYEVADIKIIFDRIKINDTIGIILEPLITGMLKTSDLENEITLTGEYRATIPKKLIDAGMDINTFVDALIKKLGLLPTHPA